MSLDKKKLVSLVIVLCSLLVSLSAYYFELLRYPELRTFDSRMQFFDSEENAGNDEIVILLIDEASIEALKEEVGRWPWPRHLYSRLLEFLSISGAKAVLFDVLFTEPQLPRDEEGFLGESDQMLVDATAANGKVFHAVQILKDTIDEKTKDQLNKPLPNDFKSMFHMEEVKKKNFPFIDTNKYYLPFKELYQASRGVGVVEFVPDEDGVYRHTRLLRNYKKSIFPVLSIAAIRQYLQPESFAFQKNALQIDDITVPIQDDGRYIVNMKQKFKTFSIAGVLATIHQLDMGETEELIFQPEEFENKIVYVGASAVGVEDLKTTSLGKNVPGVYLHASIVSNILDRDFIIKVPFIYIFIISLILCVIISLFVIEGNSLIRQWLTPVGILLLYVVFAYAFFGSELVWFEIVFPELSMLITFIATSGYHSFTEGKERRFIKGAFQQYLSPAVIDQLCDNPSMLKLGGERKELTAFFSDVQGFSTISESLTPEELVELLNEYLTEMTDIMMRYEGTVDKFEGDAIIAFFGAPLDYKDHAVRACLCSLELQQRLAEMREVWKKQGKHELYMRIGLNTGAMVVGNMGSKSRMDYTMMGDSVNLAARLEGVNKQYKTFTMISEFTYAQAKDAIEVRELDMIRVVGKNEPVRIYEVCAKKGGLEKSFEEGLKLFSEGLQLYREKAWDEAKNKFEQVLQNIENDGPAQVYIERCDMFKENPPDADWDGVFQMTSK